MKKHFIFLILILFFSVNANAQNTYTGSGYTFNAPEQWFRLNQEEEQEIKNMIGQSTGVVADLNKHFYAFKNDKDFMVMIYEVVYRNKRESLNARLEENKKNLQMGIRNNIVKKILSNQIITIDDKQFVEIDWAGVSQKKNNRNQLYVMNAPENNITLNISAFFPENEVLLPLEINTMLSFITKNNMKKSD